MAQNFQAVLLSEIRAFFDPILRFSSTSVDVYEFFDRLGWDVEETLGPGGPAFVSAVQAIGTAVQAIEQQIATPPDSLEDLLPTLEKVAAGVQAVRDLPGAASNVQSPDWPHLAEELLDHLLLEYLSRRHVSVYGVLWALGVVKVRSVSQSTQGNRVVRPAHDRPTLDLASFGTLLKDPVGQLEQMYLPNGLATQNDADAAAEKIFGAVCEVIAVLGGMPMLGVGEDPTWAAPPFDAIAKNLLTAAWRLRIGEGTSLELGTTLALVGGDKGGPGLFVSPFGEVEITEDFSRWNLDFILGTSMPAFLVTRGGLGVPQPAIPGRVNGRVTLTRRTTQAGPAFLVGSTNGTRLEIGEFSVGADAILSTTEQEFGLLTEVGHAAVIVQGGNGDGFLAKIVPPDGIKTTFDLAIGWSNTKGVYFRGSAGIEATLPVHASILGVITIDSVYLAIKLAQAGDINLVLAATGSFALGPIAASVERMGLKANFTFPKSGGNLGPASLDKFGFKLPDGAGLSIASGPVSGGGYLYIDEDKGQYAGLLQLKFKTIQLTAIGLINTKMPDGSTGFSLLIIITAKFPPIQIGFGFVLTGAGGLLGVNRTVVVDVLRSGIKARTLNSILFPDDPVRNAPQIISQLSTVFPIAQGHYVFGPMAELGWGSPVLITIEIGIVLELPSPLRLIIMGRLKLILPDEKSALVKLQMDVLGIIDFDQSEASVDATIYDSSVASFPITGDIAMRANWSSSPTFALSAGGFNPAFMVPPKFPHLDRMAIALASGDNPRLRLEAYMALTSNTAQVGAHLDAYAYADLGIIGKYSVQAYLGFDALFHFNPFSLMADMGAGASLKRNGKDFLSVYLAIHLTGPKPWHAWGTATFSFFGKHSIGFDVTIGDPAPPPQLPTADPLPDLIAAIAKIGNWSAQMPAGNAMLVSLREFKSDNLLAHPLGDLTFRQRIVPLNIDISRIGNAVPSGAHRFELEVTVSGAAPTPAPEPVKEYFAAAQFFNMSDAEKLSRPSFELFDAGIRFGTGGVLHSSAVATTTFPYETKIVDVQEQTVTTVPIVYHVDQETAFSFARSGAAAFTPMASNGAAKYPGKKFGVHVAEPTWTVADGDDLSQAAGVDGGLSYTEAAQKKQGYESGRGRRGQVVRTSEVAA